MIDEGAEAKWHVPAAAVEGWGAPEFDDGEWNAAKSGIGYGYDELVGEGAALRSAMQGKNGFGLRPVSVRGEQPRRCREHDDATEIRGRICRLSKR